jgi:hypothetical protein
MWFIMDGSESKESLNGTWLSISNSIKQSIRSDSERYPICDGDNFKINNYIFKVQELNINKYCNL